MGSYYLTDLAAHCRTTGYPVVEVGAGRSQMGSQWQHRARGSGGYDPGKPDHIIVHHTASSIAGDGWPDVNFCTFASAAKPVTNLYIARTATIYVCAAGATNCNGAGHDPCGRVADNSMNRAAIAIEAGNNGRGEAWPDVQLDCYVKLCQTLCQVYGIAVDRIHGHVEYAPGRKIDPAGPARYAEGAATWDLNRFRADVAAAPPPVEPTPPPVQPTPPLPSTNWWDALMQRMPELRKGSSGKAVKRMQHLLAAAGFMEPGNVANYDGQFGSGTEGALNRFKQAAGGQADGVCDPWAWGALMHTIDGIPTIKNGAHNSDVERMQHLLAANGFMNEGNVANYDGQWGSGTETAKTNFDRANGLTPSPPTDCGEKSWTKLLGG